jgi:hypothetical protein
MIFPSDTLLRLVNWIANRLRFDLDLREESIVGPLDEEEIADQLQYGRD